MIARCLGLLSATNTLLGKGAYWGGLENGCIRAASGLHQGCIRYVAYYVKMYAYWGGLKNGCIRYVAYYVNIASRNDKMS